MNSLIRDELLLILNVFGAYKEKEQVNILATCSKILDNQKYNDLVKQKLDLHTKSPTFDITTDFINLVLEIVNVNKKVEFYKELCEDRMKVIIYCILYNYIVKYENDSLNKIEINKMRILYFNTINVLLLKPDIIKIQKEGWISSIGRCLKIAWLIGNKILI